MKKIIPIIIALFLTNPTYAIEEIKLEQSPEKTLKEKLISKLRKKVEK